MQPSDFFFYSGILMGVLLLFMFKKDKPKLPTPLQMKDFEASKKVYKHKQLTGAKPVEAKIVEADVVLDRYSSADNDIPWASPTIMVDGKAKDAYAVLGLESGVPMAQVRAHVAVLLQGKNTTAKLDIIKRAYQAIVDANTP